MDNRTDYRAKIPIMQRLLNNVKIDDNNCWIWQGGKNKAGYGQISYLNEKWNTHRLMARLKNIPDYWTKTHVCHKPGICKSKSCINPDHLYMGDNGDNKMDEFLNGATKSGFIKKKRS